MPDIRSIRHDLKTAYAQARSWRRVAAQFGLSSGMAFRIACRNYEPHNPIIRQTLGLPATSQIIPISSAIPDGAQAPPAYLCSCGRWFISNHPRRRKCFICSPYRKRI